MHFFFKYYAYVKLPHQRRSENAGSHDGPEKNIPGGKTDGEGGHIWVLVHKQFLSRSANGCSGKTRRLGSYAVRSQDGRTWGYKETGSQHLP